MRKLFVIGSFVVIAAGAPPAWADVAPPPQDPPPSDPQPTPPPEVAEQPPMEPPADAKPADAKPADAKTADAKPADAKKSGNCSITDENNAMLGLAALALLCSGAALRRRA